MKVTHEEMKAARVPLLFRDYCAHILIPLNECRVKNWYSPFQCTELRHSYEKCQYEEFERRVAIAKIDAARAAAGRCFLLRRGARGRRMVCYGILWLPAKSVWGSIVSNPMHGLVTAVRLDDGRRFGLPV